MAGEEWGFPEREGESNGMQGESSNKKRVDFGQGVSGGPILISVSGDPATVGPENIIPAFWYWAIYITPPFGCS